MRHFNSIIGQTDQIEKNIKVLGRIRLGIKEGDPPRPREVPWFVVKDCPEVQAVYGEKPETLPIQLISNDIDTVISSAYERWGARGLLCHGNGKVAEERRTLENDNPMKSSWVWDERECPCHYLGNGCSPRGSMFFMLPDVTVAGAYMITTSSLYAIRGIQTSLLFFKQTLGRLMDIELILRRKPVDRPIPGTNGKKTHYMLDVWHEYKRDQVKPMIAARREILNIGYDTGKILEEDDEFADDAVDMDQTIEAEFEDQSKPVPAANPRQTTRIDKRTGEDPVDHETPQVMGVTFPDKLNLKIILMESLKNERAVNEWISKRVIEQIGEDKFGHLTREQYTEMADEAMQLHDKKADSASGLDDRSPKPERSSPPKDLFEGRTNEDEDEDLPF